MCRKSVVTGDISVSQERHNTISNYFILSFSGKIKLLYYVA